MGSDCFLSWHQWLSQLFTKYLRNKYHWAFKCKDIRVICSFYLSHRSYLTGWPLPFEEKALTTAWKHVYCSCNAVWLCVYVCLDFKSRLNHLYILFSVTNNNSCFRVTEDYVSTNHKNFRLAKTHRSKTRDRWRLLKLLEHNLCMHPYDF